MLRGKGDAKIEDLVRSAIRERRELDFEYEGGEDVSGTRTFAPHVLFRDQNEDLRVHGVQIAGATSSKSLPGWRQFKLSSMNDVSLRDSVFEIDEGYDPSSNIYKWGLIAGVS